MGIREKLDSLLKEKGINRREFSIRSGIPYSTISNMYDRGSEDLRLSTLVKIADFFSISVDELIEHDKAKAKKEIIELIENTEDGELLLRGQEISPELKKKLIKALDVFSE